jgi:hypothetical protein
MEYTSDEENTDIDFFQVNNEIRELCQSLNINTEKYYYNCILEEHLSSFLENKEGLKINICAYNINNTNKYPYLQYFLYKKSDFEFPSFIYKDQQDLITKSLKVIQILCKSFYKDTCFEFKGYIHEDNEIYMFFDCSHMVIDTLLMKERNDLWLGTMDEILNHQHICGFKINDSITSFFHNHPDLCYLTNEEGTHYSIPKVVYSYCEKRQIAFTSTFGIPVKNDIFGSYYYFTDYESVIKNKLNNFGLVRCLLFLGNTKIVSNLVNDTSDTSLQLLDKNLDETYLSEDYIKTKMMMKITDWDSHWTLNYDSLFIGKIVLDDGSIFDRGPLWVVQNYEQYSVISTQEIKKKKEIEEIV